MRACNDILICKVMKYQAYVTKLCAKLHITKNILHKTLASSSKVSSNFEPFVLCKQSFMLFFFQIKILTIKYRINFKLLSPFPYLV